MTDFKNLLQFVITFIIFLSCVYHVTFAKTKSKDEVEILDLTKGLSDAEIDLVLSDLSLEDLKALNELIDSSNTNDYIYEDENPGGNINGGNDYFFEDYKNEDNSMNPADSEALHNFKYTPQDELRALVSDKQRSKRENHQTRLDEEYIKQLDFSFPRDLDQNHAELSGLKKDHIRVKRN